MPRCVVGAKSLSAAASNQPALSLYSIASGVTIKVREIGVFNTTATAWDCKLIKMTAAGTPGAGLTEQSYDPNYTPQATGFQTHSATGANVDLGYRASIGAAIGAGIIWTFGDTGIMIPAGTANGIGIGLENGTGQICQAYFVWDE